MWHVGKPMPVQYDRKTMGAQGCAEDEDGNIEYCGHIHAHPVDIERCAKRLVKDMNAGRFDDTPFKRIMGLD